MKKISSTVIGSCLLACTSLSVMAEEATALEWCKSATVTGTLKKSTTQHPNGSKLVFHYLALKQPIAIAVGECEGTKLDKLVTKEIQVKEDPKVIGKFVGKTITVSGEVVAAENAYDVLPVVLYPPIVVKRE